MGDTIKRLAILGSTGSIGQQTLEVVRAHPHQFKIVGLAAGQNTELLTRQINEFKPSFVCHQAKEGLFTKTNTNYELLSLEEIACHPMVDIIVIATSGKTGLASILAAVKAGKNVALANKESLVMAGEIITREAKLYNSRIMPVDSEHSAIWQCLRGENQPPARLILTASGGPFNHHSPAQLEIVTPEQTLKHPSWRMGKKVTIDSATMMNKGLEIIEAHWLFDINIENISVLIHPQSIIHSMVEFVDGSVKAQLSYPDMRLPIQYALSYPERLSSTQIRKIDWNDVKNLTFEQPDFDTFPCLKLAIEAGREGGTFPAVLCGADEVAVEAFLTRRIKFTDIASLVEQVLAKHKNILHPTMEEISAADSWAREGVLNIIKGRDL